MQSSTHRASASLSKEATLKQTSEADVFLSVLVLPVCYVNLPIGMSRSEGLVRGQRIGSRSAGRSFMKEQTVSVETIQTSLSPFSL